VLLSLKGAIVTIDAIGCQKKIAAAIRERGADYLLALKENQPTLYRDVADFLTEQRAAGFKDCACGSAADCETTDAGHGRVEIRRHIGRSLLRPEITSDIAWLRERHPAWPDLTSIGMIEAEREEPGKPASRRIRFYITSIAPDVGEFARAARQHWGIENGLHWVLDVVYREDECRIRKRNGPTNFAAIRHMTLNLLQRTKTAKKKSVRVKRGRAALDETFLQTVLMAA
jgi:predicted transposase YbfD/YdcC